MTRTPTDRGYAFIKNNLDGTKTVYVAGAVAGTQPVDVFATHFSRPGVQITPGVHTVPAGDMVRTSGIVHVTSTDGDFVLIRGLRSGPGPILGA
ncbi:hypothetical protein AB0J86_32220 [Micromonospora sp. NPDC049559]|uniref:hypothetical protein n=1 Tax=Micromonospora sp. NPDC049559 TaxID=3155923 RepID=UPI003432C990